MSWMILINASMSTFASIKMIHFEIEYVLQCIFIMQIQQKTIREIGQFNEKNR